MKRLLLILGLVLGASTVQAYQTGDITLGLGAVYSPLALGTDFGEVNVEDATLPMAHDAKLGKPGMGGELQALYFVSPRVGLGLGLTDQYFAKDLSSGWQLNTKTRMRNYMVVGHVLLTPQNAFRFYIPVGIGWAQTDFSMDFSPLGDPKKHFRYSGFSYYAGLGVERDVSARFAWALEARYNANRFHDSATRGNGDHVSVYPRANFFSVLARIIYKI